MRLPLLLLLIPFSILYTYQVSGQELLTNATGKNYLSQDQDIVSIVKSHIDSPTDKRVISIFSIVRDHCSLDVSCLYETYSAVLEEINRGHRCWQGVPVAEEMLRIAEAQGDTSKMAIVVKTLADLHGFLGNRKEHNLYYQKLLELYKQTGNIQAFYRTKFFILEGRVKYLNEVEDGIGELEILLEEVWESRLEKASNYMLVRLKFLYETYGFQDKLIQAVEALERIPKSNPIKPEEVLTAFHAASGRADILRMNQQYDQAVRLYLEAQEIVRPRYFAYHDTWLEIYVLHRLAGLEWERGRSIQAKTYLDAAYKLADTSKMYSELIFNLKKQVKIAEGENRFEDALRYTREIYAHQEIIDRRSKGFDDQRYQLELIRKQLTADNKEKALQLRIKDNQISIFSIIALLFTLLLVRLFIALYKQRKARQVLAIQHALVNQQAEELKVRMARLLQNQSAQQEATEKIPHQLTVPIPKEDREWLEQFELYVKHNISNTLLSVPLIAEEFSMSESSLRRQLKRLTGLTPKQYIQEVRLGTARQLIEHGRYTSVARVAHEVGYKNTTSFSRAFKKQFGKLPSDLANAS